MKSRRRLAYCSASWRSAAEKIGSDARQVSRYESGRVAPSLEAVVRIAETFNTGVDYLVAPDAPRRPCTPPATPSAALLRRRGKGVAGRSG